MRLALGEPHEAVALIAQLIARLKDEGRTLGCNEVQLISRVTREQAHRFYFREGFGIECFHFRAKLRKHPARGADNSVRDFPSTPRASSTA
jgi:hypothetical protein